MTKLKWIFVAIVSSGLFSNLASAGVVYSVSGNATQNDGPISATVEFKAVTGGIEVIVTNTQTGTLDKGQAVSAISFLVNQALLGAPTAFTELKAVPDGNPLSNGGPQTGGTFSPHDNPTWSIDPPRLGTFSTLDDTSTGPAIDHWGFAVSGSSVNLATAGSSVAGATGNPHYMILPGSGAGGGSSALDNGNFGLFIAGPTAFFLTVANVTSSTVLSADMFSSVSVGFGTTPDTTLTDSFPGIITFDQSPVPEPGSIAVWGVFGLVGTVCWRRLRASI